MMPSHPFQLLRTSQWIERLTNFLEGVLQEKVVLIDDVRRRVEEAVFGFGRKVLVTRSNGGVIFETVVVFAASW